MLNPTLYAVLMDRAVTTPADDVKGHLEKMLRAATADLAPAVVDALREAYAAGVRDGFAQGVAATSDTAIARERTDASEGERP